ncbi:glycosyltransferase family 2 protein [uncultured Limosilactobacillus sp.]|uniref:glycosyltransferase family 2 protein n=1 Tax=uncultured Limosilactobacillus sp. TaxID=2837629 RepID=UPI0025FCC3BC|nr:glycosyltransferase family 2 protein [uncultured Limosilactobacillus sp.]
MDKISVIVPVYNVAPYLKQCLDSIVSQTYRNLEIILVNDGSTDNSLKICQQYQEQDKRIRVISQKNAGLSAARNTGLNVANGQYVTFVDSDDWFATNNAIATLHRLIDQYHVKIAIGNFDEFDESVNSYRLFGHDDVINVYPTQKWFAFEYTGDKNLSQCFSTAWGKLFDQRFFKHVRFPVGKIDEDDLTIWKLYLQTSSVAFINQAMYIYRNNRSDSITGIANPAQLFSLSANEQRIAMETILNMDPQVDQGGYLWRLNTHYQNALAAVELANYKHSLLSVQIVNKYHQEQ